jgi:serine/threonine protein phosphatase 1
METAGRRIYAIGDIHGCRTALAAVHAAIARDLAAAPHPDSVVVHVGDLVDRGPDSRGVIEDLLRWDLAAERVCLLGNHDEAMLRFLEDPHAMLSSEHWVSGGMGGGATLASYGLDPRSTRLEALHRAALAAVPAAHRAFLEGLPRLCRIGSYVFVHAGIRPGVPLDRQHPDDLVWIRGDFLRSRADHGAVVVHGHTPVRAVEVRPNRIGIDTGAVFGGRLSCLVLEGPGRWLLGEEGRQQL